ncbi:class I SAM-dependent methyltransferase [Chitinimonas sp.]|uniref:class I SAM-dependent methyltransferase n=1 Tax=Chitinimonas sp. TaxID=1934313 RepID=UPI0035AD8B51
MTSSHTYASRPALPAIANIFLKVLGNIRSGHLTLITPQGESLLFGDAHHGPTATLQIHDWQACRRILLAGDIGFAESLSRGWLDSPDLTALLTLALRNESAMPQTVTGSWLARLWYALQHRLRRNSRAGSRRNIPAHYDLGNDFYRLWLDPSWTYSSAVFAGNHQQSLEQAQQAKYQRIIDQLGLRAGMRVLEVGCGWGGFAEYAGRLGIAVEGITLSPAQLQFAQARIEQAGLTALVQLRLQDYRDVAGEFDAIVSIEMFEAVGEQYWPGYFKMLQQRLTPGGKALVQSITIDEQRFAAYRASSDFIREYIFPGGMLPSKERFVAGAQARDLHTLDQYAFGRDYAETLRRWRADFELQLDSVRQQGFDEAFIRTWRLYYAYCEAGFDEGRTDVVQFTLQRAR